MTAICPAGSVTRERGRGKMVAVVTAKREMTGKLDIFPPSTVSLTKVPARQSKLEMERAYGGGRMRGQVGKL